MRCGRVVPGGAVYLRGIHDAARLETHGENLPADVSHIRHGRAAGAYRQRRGPMASGGSDAAAAAGSGHAPWSSLYGADFYRGILLRRLAESPGYLSLGLYRPPQQHQRSDPSGLCAPVDSHRSPVRAAQQKTAPLTLFCLAIPYEDGIMYTKAISSAADDRYPEGAVLARATAGIWKMP